MIRQTLAYPLLVSKAVRPDNLPALFKAWEKVESNEREPPRFCWFCYVNVLQVTSTVVLSTIFWRQTKDLEALDRITSSVGVFCFKERDWEWIMLHDSTRLDWTRLDSTRLSIHCEYFIISIVSISVILTDSFSEPYVQVSVQDLLLVAWIRSCPLPSLEFKGSRDATNRSLRPLHLCQFLMR